ncbi:hypothetical protein [Endozoicomonas numazuensis]|uniref:hypothetical protein n=1 Tax=Endozoicomonas numazuensis TaxID=1137799 RepID=UPI0012678FAA|nr:hypothetical protein [Endozoicomonas numazuensis]
MFDRFSVKGGVDQGKRIFVTVDQKSIYDFLETNHAGDYHLTALVCELLNLSADPFPSHSRAIDSNQSNKRQLTLDGGCIKYYLYSGDVYIEKLEHGNSFQNLKREPISGLHEARYDSDEKDWSTTKTASINTGMQLAVCIVQPLVVASSTDRRMLQNPCLCIFRRLSLFVNLNWKHEGNIIPYIT